MDDPGGRFSPGSCFEPLDNFCRKEELRGELIMKGQYFSAK